MYVQAQLDKHKISNVNNYMFTSNAISAAYFTVKNNDIVNVSNIPAEELNDFANNEVLTKKANVKYTK